MGNPRHTLADFVVCINNSGYPASLELHKIYRVVRDEDAAADGDIRVVDESGEDYLYPASFFVPIKIPPRSKNLCCTRPDQVHSRYPRRNHPAIDQPGITSTSRHRCCTSPLGAVD